MRLSAEASDLAGWGRPKTSFIRASSARRNDVIWARHYRRRVYLIENEICVGKHRLLVGRYVDVGMTPKHEECFLVEQLSNAVLHMSHVLQTSPEGRAGAGRHVLVWVGHGHGGGAFQVVDGHRWRTLSSLKSFSNVTQRKARKDLSLGILCQQEGLWWCTIILPVPFSVTHCWSHCFLLKCWITVAPCQWSTWGRNYRNCLNSLHKFAPISTRCPVRAAARPAGQCPCVASVTWVSLHHIEPLELQQVLSLWSLPPWGQRRLCYWTEPSSSPPFGCLTHRVVVWRVILTARGARRVTKCAKKSMQMCASYPESKKKCTSRGHVGAVKILFLQPFWPSVLKAVKFSTPELTGSDSDTWEPCSVTSRYEKNLHQQQYYCDIANYSAGRKSTYR